VNEDYEMKSKNTMTFQNSKFPQKLFPS